MTRPLPGLPPLLLLCLFGCNLQDPAISLPGAAPQDMSRSLDAAGIQLPADMAVVAADLGPVERDMAGVQAFLDEGFLDQENLGPDMSPASLPVTLGCQGLDELAFEGPALCVPSKEAADRQRATATGIVGTKEAAFALNDGTTPGIYRYESVVLDLGAPQTLRAVSWRQNVPFDLSLPLTEPGGRGVEPQVYERDGTHMGSVVRLQLFDPESLEKNMAGATVLKDQSNFKGSPDMIQHDSAAEPALPEPEPSPLGTALPIKKAAHYVMPIQAEALQFGQDPFTLGVWAKHDEKIEENRVIFGMYDDNRQVDGYSQFWLGYAAGSFNAPGSCKGASVGAPLAMFVSKEARRVALCGPRSLNDGTWHHLAVVRDASVHRLFVDGQLASEFDHGEEAFEFSWTPKAYDARLGSFPSEVDRYDTNVILDEFALWRRPLAASEILRWTERALTRLTLEVAFCDTPGACAMAPWVALPLERSVAPDTLRTAQAPQGAGAQSGRFFRYRVTMALSAAVSTTPAIKGLRWEFEE